MYKQIVIKNDCEHYHLTSHAWSRMGSRSISPQKMETVLKYGRSYYSHKAKVYVIGRKEVEHFGRKGVDLRELEGIRVVCSMDGSIITTYKNKDFSSIRKTCKRKSA